MNDPSENSALNNAAGVIEALGGIRPTAAKLGVPVTTVQGWKKRGVIPAARHTDILRVVREAGIDLSVLPPAASPPAVAETPARTDPGSAQMRHPPDTQPPPPAPGVLHVHHMRTATAADAEEAAIKAKAAEKARQTPPFFTESIPPDLIEKIQRIETKSTRTAAIIATIFVGAAICFTVILLWPTARKVEEYDDRLTAVEGTVMHLGEEGADPAPAPDSGWVAELDRRMEDWKRQAGEVKDGVETALGQAKAAMGDVVGPEAGPLSERLARLEEKVGQMTGSPALATLLDRLQGYTATAEGQGTLDTLVARLRDLAAGNAPAPGTDPDAAFSQTLDTARTTDPVLGEAFDGVEPRDLKAAALLVGFTKLRESLNRGSTPFEKDLDLLLNLVGDDNPELKQSLLRLAPHAKEGVLTPSGLSDQLRGLAGDVVAASLSGEDVSFEERAKARLNEVLQIEKKGELVTGTGTQAKVAKAQTALDSGDIPGAIAELQGLEGAAAQTVLPLIEQAQATALAAQVRSAIDHFARIRAIGAGSKYTTGFKGLSDLIPPPSAVTDAPSGVTVLPPGPQVPGAPVSPSAP